jgi:protease I
MKKILIPLPHFGFDPSEAAIPWKILSEKGASVVFAAPSGRKASADERMLTGNGLGIFKKILMARKDAVTAYKEMENCDAFSAPLSYHQLEEKNYDALLLPGGHDKAVREYLESKTLQQLVVQFFKANKPVAAVCHGVLLVARSIDAATGKSVLYKKETTCLLKSQEMLAYRITALWLKDYYLTYPGTTTQDEVISFLENKTQFKKGPMPFSRDTATNASPAFIVTDGNYLSARWPGDIYAFSNAFCRMLGLM